MAETQLYYIATSKVKEIRKGGEVTRYDWGSYGAWTKFKSPAAYKKVNVAYSAKTKNKVGAKNGKARAGGSTVLGTKIPATASRQIDGVSRTVDVRYWQRGYTIYTRTSDLKKKKKMLKTTYSSTKPYQYRLQYKDKPVVDKVYSEYIDGYEYTFFSDVYYADDGTETATDGHIAHPITCSVTYSDVRRNFDSTANNQDGRDNSGSYVMSNVRANVVTIELEWAGLSDEQGMDLLDTLNPDKTHPYIIAQFRDPQTGAYRNGTFYASERKTEKYPNGMFKTIEVTLTEV